MLNMRLVGFLALFFLTTLTSSCADESVCANDSGKIVKAVAEGFYGAQLQKLPEVEKFLMNDVPLFHDVRYKIKEGVKPVLNFVTDKRKVVESIELQDLTREEINSLLLQRGFVKKEYKDQVLDEQVLSGLAYKSREEL